MSVERPFRYAGHARVHRDDEACDCPDDWPRDLSPGACVRCYHDKAIDRPAYQCQDHPQADRVDKPRLPLQQGTL